MGSPNPLPEPVWSVAIFSARETLPALSSTLDAALSAIGSERAVVDVIVNGHPRVARALATARSRRPAVPVNAQLRIWDLSLRDKAVAWNIYVRDVWPGSRCAFFLDGMAAACQHSFSRLSARLRREDQALVAAAVPTMGRSAASLRARMLRSPQIHGSFYAVRGETLAQIRANGFAMPMGFYRTDALLGILCCLNFDPPAHEWDYRRIEVVDDATWSMPLKSIWRPRDVAEHTARVIRQSVGKLEEAAIKDLFFTRRQPISAMPVGVGGMVTQWMAREPVAARQLLARYPLARVRMAAMMRPGNWRRATEPARCLWTS